MTRFRRIVATAAFSTLAFATAGMMTAGEASASTVIPSGSGCRAPYTDSYGRTLTPCIGYASWDDIVSWRTDGPYGPTEFYGHADSVTLTLMYRSSPGAGWRQVDQQTYGDGGGSGERIFWDAGGGWATGNYYIAESYMLGGVSHDWIESPILTLSPCC